MIILVPNNNCLLGKSGAMQIYNFRQHFMFMTEHCGFVADFRDSIPLRFQKNVFYWFLF
jgi:hypothetical protein